MRVLKSNCKLEDANDRSLPYTCYLVTYLEGSEERYDLVICNKQVEIFDYYWDLYRENFVGMKQSEGRVNPKLWVDPNKQPSKKEK